VGPSIKHAYGYEYWIRGDKLYVGTAWFVGAPGELGDYSGWQLAGTQCGPGAWPARYKLSYQRGRPVGGSEGVTGYARNLVLAAEKEPCAKRRRILEGIWEGFGS